MPTDYLLCLLQLRESVVYEKSKQPNGNKEKKNGNCTKGIEDWQGFVPSLNKQAFMFKIKRASSLLIMRCTIGCLIDVVPDGR